MNLVGGVLAAASSSLVGLCSAPAESQPQNFEQAVGLTIHNTFQQLQSDDVPPDAAIREYRRIGQERNGDRDGLNWAYRHNPTDRDGREILLDAAIVQLYEGWQPDPAQVAAWEPFAAGTHDTTGAEIFHRVSERGVKRSAVFFKLQRGGLELDMRVIREMGEQESAAELIAKATPWWEFFVAEAERNGLLDAGARIYVEVIEGPWDFSGLAPEDTLVTLYRPGTAAREIPLRVWAQGPNTDEPYTIGLRLKDELGRGGITVRDASGRTLRDSDGDGAFEVQAPGDGEPAEITIHVPGSERPDAMGQVAQLRFEFPPAAAEPESPPATADMAVQTIDWFPVLMRFEIAERNDNPIPIPDEERRQPRERLSPGELSSMYERAFNSHRESAGTLLLSWMNIEFDALTRKGLNADDGAPLWGPNEPVLMGWRIEPDSKLSFLTLENSPKTPEVVAFTYNKPYFLLADVDIIVSSTPIGGGDWDDPFAVTNDPLPAEESITPEKLREEIFIDADNSFMTLRRVSEEGVGLPREIASRPEYREYNFEREERELAQALRQAVTEGSEVRPDAPELVIWRVGGFERLDDHFPQGGWRRAALEWKTTRFDTLNVRTPGIYEVRFKLSVFHKTIDNAQDFDVAIRYNIPRTGWTSFRHSFQSRRVP